MVTTLLLAGGMAVIGLVLDASVRAALDQEQREFLDSQLITLLAVAEPQDEMQLQLPYDLPEQRFNAPGSGLYAKVRDRDGAFLWRSGSAVGLDFSPDTPLPEPGQREFLRQQTSDGDTLLTLTLGIVWTFDDGRERYFALSAAESEDNIIAPLRRFRGRMFATFALVAGGLLIAMGILLSWLLRPLGRIANEITEVESGSREALSEAYPSELSGVARNLNALMSSEQRRTQRYQQTLSNLAHSLKTPLAAAKALLQSEQHPKGDAEGVQSQLQRMEQIVRYQLARPAIAARRTVGGGKIQVDAELGSMLDALDKVYREKGITAELDFGDDVLFYGDRGDLVEMLGNLLDNAYKWGRSRVLVKGRRVASKGAVRIQLEIEDDGPGMPADEVAAALRRGTRLDESVPGTGIGLAVVAELVSHYEGALGVTRGSLGGASVQIELPGA